MAILYSTCRDTTLEKEGVKGSKVEVTLEYSTLQCVDVTSRTDEKEFKEKMAMDDTNADDSKTQIR